MPILTSTNAHGAVITIDRQERRNALNLASLEALHEAVTAAVQGGSRTLVLTGAGGHFCAGADLTELEDVSFTQRLAEVLRHLAAVPITTIAAIDGSCMGLGMQLAMACDVRVVDADARFAIPVAKLGLMVDHWTVDRARRLFGEGAARHLLLTAAVLDSDDAWRLGFAQVRGDLEAALSLAARTSALAPLSQAGSKLGLEASAEDETAMADYAAAFATAWASADLGEGQRAFTERRTPRFEGR